MPKYQLNVEGRNYLMRFHPTHRPEKHAFYTKFFVEAATEDDAENNVVDLLHADQSITDFLCNADDDPPTFKIEKMFEIADWPECARPRIGLAWFPENPRESLRKV